MNDDGAVAIVGMACRLPGADTVGQFWANLRAGAETIARFSPAQLAAAGVAPELAARPDYVPARGVLAGGDRFDWAFFGYSPGEAAGIDPQQRVLLECAATALDDAAVDPQRFPGLIGVFAGCDAGGSYQPGDGSVVDVVGTDKDFLATRIAYKLGLRGPAMTIQTACSTSLVAVHVAAQNLLNYECDAALAGGVSLVLPQTIGYRYVAGHILSPDGHCRPFDAAAAGTVPSSGAGLVVLRRLADALADGSRVIAVIRGSAVNNDGGEKIGYTAPSVSGQRDVIRMAVARADVDPADIDYVEAHGTGTPIGDPVELAALAAALDDGTGRDRPRRLGAVKGNIGHTGAASGVAGLVKTASMLAARELVPTVHFRRPNPELPLGSFQIGTSHEAWQPEGALLAGVSSFGIGGTNAHVVLESAPVPRPRAGRTARPRVLCVSAASPLALAGLRTSLADRLATEPAPDLSDVEFTLAVGRRRFPYRVARVAGDVQGAVRALRSAATTSAEGQPRIAFVFPGQGTLRAGAGAEAYALLPEFRRTFDEIRAHTEVNLDAVVDATADPQWTSDVLHQQLGLFALGYALAAQLAAWRVHPVAMLGHSIGEYVAATVAGVWRLPDAVALVSARGRAMRAAPPGRMLAVSGADAEALPGIIGGELTLAIDAPGYRVVSGPPEAIAELAAKLDAAGAGSRLLDTAGGFHSPLMRPAAGPLRAALTASASQAPRLPFVSNLTGGWADDRIREPDYWVRHLCEPVRLTDGFETLLSASVTLVVELGPGDSMVRLARRRGAQVAVPVLGLDGPLAALAALWERGVDVGWQDVLAGGDGRRCALPPHPLEPRSCSPARPTPVRPADVVSGLSWPDRPTSLSDRPDLRTRLDTYCAGLVADLVRQRRLTLDGGELPRLAQMIKRMLVTEGLLDAPQRVAAALAERDGLDEVAGLRRLVEHCVSAYPAVFAGERTGVSVLFPDAEDTLLREGYRDNDLPVDDSAPCLDALVTAVRALWTARGGGGLRVLEVGAGQGDLAARLLADLPDLSYHVTDVSALSVRRAAARLPSPPASGSSGHRVSTLDITQDPVRQGFAPGSYDLVLAHNVLHVAPDVRAALRYLARLLAPGGWLGMVELTRADRWSHLIWGLAPGWWDFADDLRQSSPHLDAQGWLRVLGEQGFDAVSAAPPGTPDHTLFLASATERAAAVHTSGRRPSGVLEEVWCEVLGVADAPQDDDDFFALGGESLLAVSLVTRVRERLGVRVALPAFTREPTFGRLAELVRAERRAAPADGLLALHSGGERTPLFLAAPAAGSPLVYRTLAGLLGEDRPVYGLESPGLHDGERPLERFEDIAARHVDALRARFPTGPYLLGGWSVGAMVAHEMARQLPGVRLLVCIDGYLPDTGGRRLGTLPRQAARGLRYRMQARRQLRAVAAESPEFLAVYHASIRAMLRYTPRPVSCAATVFHSGLTDRRRDRLRAQLAPLYHGGVDVRPVPGDHWTVLTEPRVATLAAGIREVLP
uniref:Polyketide synthase n=1 Tax=uncultured bacterium AZ_40 TaxID=1630016 RepID=A0A0E3JRN4_9BACT|nr:polyketide synthase [uncultured bacterium AZ_40]